MISVLLGVICFVLVQVHKSNLKAHEKTSEQIVVLAGQNENTNRQLEKTNTQIEKMADNDLKMAGTIAANTNAISDNREDIDKNTQVIGRIMAADT